MPRKRKTENQWLPPNVYEDGGRYVYRKGKTAVRLCSTDSSKAQVWMSWERLTAVSDHSFSSLAMEYFNSDKFSSLAVRTQRDYQNHYAAIRHYETRYGKFADLDRNIITPGMMQQYLDDREAKVQANREVAFVSAVFAWGYARDKCDSNPCRGVQRNPERPRDYYIPDSEYHIVYMMAGTPIRGHARPWYIQPMMEFAYLCRMREIEVLNLKKSDILQNGLDTRRVKGSNDTITLWSDRLRRAVDQCLVQRGKIDSVYLFHNGKGGRITQSAFQSAWQRLMRVCPVNRFTFHDIKAKGMTDGKNKKAGGHKTEQAANVYMRGKDEIDATR